MLVRAPMTMRHSFPDACTFFPPFHRYESCKRYLAELIRQKYGKEDLPLTEVNGELVRAFEFNDLEGVFQWK